MSPSRAGDEEFIASVAWAWQEKEDPTRTTDWDEERCRRLMPEFYEAWCKYKVYKAICDKVLA